MSAKVNTYIQKNDCNHYSHRESNKGLMTLETSNSKELQLIDTMVPGRDLNAYISAVKRHCYP